jgi:hypothetical protein
LVVAPKGGDDIEKEEKPMTTKDSRSEWEKLRAGHLDEGETEKNALLGRGKAPSGGVEIRIFPIFRARQIAPLSRLPELHRRTISLKLKGIANVGVTPFHIAVSNISRQRCTTIPPCVQTGKKVIIYPTKSQINLVKSEGGKRNWRNRVWTINVNNRFLQTLEGAAMAKPSAGALRLEKLGGRNAVKTSRSAQRFQIYMERADRDAKTQREEVEHDKIGPISFGNIGKDLATRIAFWDAVDAAEKRADAKLQSRLIAELPYWVSAEARREIVTRFAEVFDSRSLGFWASVHRPATASGSDPRNFHLQLIWHDRAVEAWNTDGKIAPTFAPTKDRTFAGPAWITNLRTKFAEAVNAVVLEEAQRLKQLPPRLFFEGSYEALGIHVTPQRHLGPGRTALLRKGIVTSAAERNDGIDQIDTDIRAARATKEIEQEISAWEFLRRISEVDSKVARYAPDHPAQSAHSEVLRHQRDIEQRIKRALGAVASWRRNRNADSENIYLKRLEGEAERLRRDIRQHEKNIERLQKRHDSFDQLEKLQQQRREEDRSIATSQLRRHTRLPDQTDPQFLKASQSKWQLQPPQSIRSGRPSIILENQVESRQLAKTSVDEQHSREFSEWRRRLQAIDDQNHELKIEGNKQKISAAQNSTDAEKQKPRLEIQSDDLVARQTEVGSPSVSPYPPPEKTTKNAEVNSVRRRDESWLGKFAQRDKWRFCLTAARMAA